MEKVKTFGEYKLDIKRHLEDDGEHLKVSISLNKPFVELLSFFAVKKEYNEDNFNSLSYTRYLVKRVLTNSVNFNGTVMFLFNKELIDNGKIEVRMDNSILYDYMLREKDNIKAVIIKMIELSKDRNVVVNYKVEEQ